MSEVMTWATEVCHECINAGCGRLKEQGPYNCRARELLKKKVEDDELWDWLEWWHVKPKIYHTQAEYVASQSEGSKQQ